MWAILAFFLLAVLYGVLILFGVTLQLIGLLATGPMESSLGSVYQQMGIDPASFARMGLGMWLPSIFGLLLLLRFVRNLVGRILPSFDPTSPVHAVALSYTALIAVNLFMTLGIGLGNLAEMVQAAGPMDLTASLWAQQIVMAIMAISGGGLAGATQLRRDLPASGDRQAQRQAGAGWRGPRHRDGRWDRGR